MIKFKALLLFIFSAALIFSFSVFDKDALAQLILSELTVGNDFGVGARAMGMGGAFIGVADDYTALHWNPGGLSQIKRMEFFTALSHERSRAETEYYGSSDSTFASRTRINAIGMVIPVPVYQGGLAFAFGVNRVQSFDSRIRFKGFNESTVDEDYELGQLFVDDLSDESGGIFLWSFGGAVDIAPKLSIGGNLSFITGDYDLDFKRDAEDTEENDLVLTGYSYRDTISSDYFGVEGKIGLLARPANQIHLGATINFPLDLTVDEYWSRDSYYEYDDGTNESYFEDGTFTYDIYRPFRFSAGIAAYPIPEVAIAADATYTDWTQTEYDEPPSEDISNEDFQEYYRDTLQLRIGTECTIPSAGVRIRAGYILDPKPYAPNSMVIETERQFITFGVGMMMEEVFSLDLVYMRGFWKERTDDEFIKEDHNTNRIFLSAGFSF